MKAASPTERVVAWLLPAVWVVVAVLGDGAVAGALDTQRGELSAVARLSAVAVWAVAAVVMAIPAATTLTLMRVVVPISAPALVVAWAFGADSARAVPAIAGALVATVLAGTAEVGRRFVQASAYGDEDRHVLRAPLAYLMFCAVAWLLMATTLITGVILITGRSWIAGAACATAAVAIGWWSWRRWHRLARRWLVIVPAGLVLHDHLVLAETLMIPRRAVRAVRLAPADTAAADLTGPATGHAVEIETLEPITALVAPAPGSSNATAIHLTCCLVSPTRPGRLLAGISGQRMPLG